MTARPPDLVLAVHPRPDPDEAAVLADAVTSVLADHPDPGVPAAHRSRWRAAAASEALDGRPVLP